MNKVESTPLGKMNKEEQIRAALRLKRDARLDKAKRTWAKGHNTPVKWISMKRTRSSPFEIMRGWSNNTMPPEEMKECNENKNKKQAQMKHTAKQGNPGRHLKLRSWGVTTLHHYERISSWDLEWHRRENGREREEVKLSCFFDKRVKPKNLERLNNFEKKNTTEMNEVEDTPLGKRNTEEQIRAALRLKRYERLDKMKRTWAEAQHSG